MVYIWTWSWSGVVTPSTVTARVLIFIVVATFLDPVGIGGGAPSVEGAVVVAPSVLAVDGVVVGVLMVKAASSSLVGGGQAADGRWRKPFEGR